MANTLRTTKTTDVQPPAPAAPSDRATASACHSGMLGCGMGKKGLKGLLLMAACCGAPLLLLLVLPVIGSALGGIGISMLSTLAYLACPVGMGLMMWMMMRAQQAALQQIAQEQPTVPQVASPAPVMPQEETIYADITEMREAAIAPPARPQAQGGTPSRRVNGHQAVVQPVGHSGTPAASRPQE